MLNGGGGGTATWGCLRFQNCSHFRKYLESEYSTHTMYFVTLPEVYGSTPQIKYITIFAATCLNIHNKWNKQRL